MADGSQELPENFGPIVERLEPSLGPLDGEPRALDGGITNRNYRATFGGAEYVVRIPGRDTDLLGIDRTAERTAGELAAALGIAPKVAAFLADPPCLVTEFVSGSAMTEHALRSPGALATVARALRRLHDCGRQLPSRFDSVAIVDDYARVASERGAGPPREFAPARERAGEIQRALSGDEHAPVPCHNDLLAANFLDAGEGVLIVDWEYAGMGDRYFDLANFAVNNGLDEAGQTELLGLYWGAPRPDALAALRAMTFMSDFREAMWGVVQGAVSDLDFDFEAYAQKHFRRMGHGASDAAD